MSRLTTLPHPSALRRIGNSLFPVPVAALLLLLVAMAGTANAQITNTVTVTGSFGGAPVTDTATETVDVEDAASQLTITKSAVLNDEITADGFAEAGETITYSFAVENTGNVTLTNIFVNDTHGGTGPPLVLGGETLTADNGTIGDSTDAAVDGVWDTIAPGDIVTFTATYTVNQTDVDTLQ